jgi:hypothetical protein
MERKIFLLLFLYLISCQSFSKTPAEKQIIYQNEYISMYPNILPEMPALPSPYTFQDSIEVVVIQLKNQGFSVVPVTVENGEPYSCQFNLQGKGKQLQVNREIPGLYVTGLYSEQELEQSEYFGRRSLAVLNIIAKPGAFSSAGFIAEDENIKSVFIGDNRLVKKMDLKHRQLAIPLFQVWNLLREIRTDISYMFYNNLKIPVRGSPTKNYQDSIFHDEIQGTWDISIWRELLEEEEKFLNSHYTSLSPEDLSELKYKLSHLRIGEMHPFYIMRYGFYEGHTFWRADPIVISFIFGLKSLPEIENYFKCNLYYVLTQHYTEETVR